MNNDHRFDELCNKVRFCTRCERMEDSARVLTRAAGSLDAEVMFIGEAPGRLGADETEIPFHGDQAGHNFEELLAFAGMNRSEVFVTNAVLCNPRNAEGNNATPSREEARNCSSYLREQIDLVVPKVVVTLGATALEALKNIEPHNVSLSQHVRTVPLWYGRRLIPLYHPGARALIHRSMANQRSDYQFVAEQLRKLVRTPKRTAPSATKAEIASIVKRVLAARSTVSYFALHKIFFLLECEAKSTLGHTLTNAYFIRQKDGPYCTDLHLAKLKKSIANLTVIGTADRLTIGLRPGGMFDTEPSEDLGREAEQLLARVLAATAGLSESELKTRAYLTQPMRRMLRIERTQLINLYNSPIALDQTPAEANKVPV